MLGDIRAQPYQISHITQDRRVMVERSDRMWSTGEGNGKPLQYSCLENTMLLLLSHFSLVRLCATP